MRPPKPSALKPELGMAQRAMTRKQQPMTLLIEKRLSHGPLPCQKLVFFWKGGPLQLSTGA